MTAGRRVGFTLVEIMVAVVLTGVVALLAHQLFSGAVLGSRRLQDLRLDLDRRANALQFLRAAFLSLEVGADSAGPFEGHHDRIRFATWIAGVDGWAERRTLEIRLDGDRWVAVAPPDFKAVLADSVTALGFGYLLEPGAQSKWVSEWQSPVSAPLGVRVAVRRAGQADTLLFLIKARG